MTTHLTLEEADTVMRELGLEPMPGSPFKTPYEWYQRLAVQLRKRDKDLRELIEETRTDTRDPRIPCDMESEALQANDLWTDRLEDLLKAWTGR